MVCDSHVDCPEGEDESKCGEAKAGKLDGYPTWHNCVLHVLTFLFQTVCGTSSDATMMNASTEPMCVTDRKPAAMAWTKKNVTHIQVTIIYLL